MSAPKTERPLRASWHRWLVAVGILALLFLLDERIHETVFNPYSGWFMNFVSKLRGVAFVGGAGLAMIAMGMGLRRPKVWRAGVAMLLAVLLAAGVVGILKPIVGRPGPRGPEPPVPEESWIEARWGRFPSGHIASTFAAAAALAAFYPATAPVGYAIGALVGYERVHRGVHWSTDVFAGACIGLVSARLVVRWLRRRDRWRVVMAEISQPSDPSSGTPGGSVRR